MRVPVPAVLALALAVPACAAPGPAPEPVPVERLWPEGPHGVAVSPDGKCRLHLRHVGWSHPGARGGPELALAAEFEPADVDTLVALDGALRRVVTPDGVDHPPARREGPVREPTPSFSGAMWGPYDFREIGEEESCIALLTYVVPVMRVASWKSFDSGEVRCGEARTIEAPPFRIAVEAGPEVLDVRVSGGLPGFLDAYWAGDALEILDRRGVRLRTLCGSGGESESTFEYAEPRPDGRGSFAIAYPATVSLRLPGEYAVEIVPFGFRDVVVPPRPGGPFRTAAPAYDESALRPWDPWGGAWSAWSEPVGGLSCRVCLPGRTPRDARLPATLLLRLDPDPSEPEVQRFDGRDLEGRLALNLRHRAEGWTLRLPLDGDSGKDSETRERGDVPGTEPPADTGCILLRDGVVREWAFGFPLWRDLGALEAGEYEASIEVEVTSSTVPPDAWSGTAATPPVPLVVEEEATAPVEVRLRVPRTLRLRPGGWKGSVDVAFGPAESEVVLVHPRPGYRVLSRTDHLSGLEEVSWDISSLPLGPVVDTLDPEEKGPLDAVYGVEILEVLEEEGFEPGSEPDRRGCRTLWKRTYRVRASAEEIEALRR